MICARIFFFGVYQRGSSIFGLSSMPLAMIKTFEEFLIFCQNFREGWSVI